MLINIQFLLFAAAMLVVVYHMCAHVRATGTDPGGFFILAEAVGFAGVDIFFVISGFIMAHTTGASKGLADGGSFLRRRIARIYSGYWPFFALALLVFWWVNPAHLEQASLTRSAVLWPANVLLIAVSWTLVFEMFFYLVFTFLVAGGLHRTRHFLLCITLAMVAFSVYSQFVRHAYDPGRLETISLAEYYMLSPYLVEFLVGALLADRLKSCPSGPAAILFVLGGALFLAGGWINVGGFDGNIEQGYFVFWRVAVFGTAAGFIVAGAVRLEHARICAPRRFSLAAGGASYAVYLSHTLFLAVTQHTGLNRWLTGQDAWFVQSVYLLYAVLILLHGLAHYRWVERPLHRAFRKILGIGRTAAA